MAMDELLQQLYDLSVDVIFSLSVPEGLILSLSPAFTELTGWPVEEWIGQPFIDLIYPDDRESALQSYAERVDGGGPGPFSWRVNTSTGSALMAEFTSSLIFTGSKLTSIVGIARDITERRRVEDELERRSRQIIHILNSISDGFYMLDNDWRYVMINKTAMDLVGKPASKIIGKVFWEVRSPKTVEALRAKFMIAKESGKVEDLEVYDTEHKCWFEVRAYPHEEGLAVYFTDVSVHKRAEEQLKKHSEGVEKILADILGIQEKWR